MSIENEQEHHNKITVFKVNILLFLVITLKPG